LSRLLTATAPLSAEWMIGPDHPRTVLLSDAAVLRCTEGVIRKVVGGEGGVILGRAAAIVLRDHPGAFHVRLDGDPDRRVRQAMALQGMSDRDAREAMDRNDRARTAYVRHFYSADAASPRHYDLVIDSTRIPIEACTEMIVSAARSCSGKKG
jgi:cytidylate kinase